MPIDLSRISIPDFEPLGDQPVIPSETYDNRARLAYERSGVDWLVVYADREHFGNIVFLTGFEPRFEEAFLLIGPGGRRVLVTGNESESYAVVARLPQLEVIRGQSLSLMGQDRSREPRLAERFRDAGIKAGDSIGLVGWKYLRPEEDEEAGKAFYVPHAYVRMLLRIAGPDSEVVDRTAILMDPESGLRSVIDVDQIAAFEWTAARCSRMVWRIVTGVRIGDSEYEAAARMGYAGEPFNAHPMFASSGPEAAVIGLRSPTTRRMSEGDGVTTAVGLWGALSSRAGVLSKPEDTFKQTAVSYFKGLIAWYATADIGVAGSELYAAVVDTLAEGGLRPALNPGHLSGHEEWSHSPVRPGSKERLGSGMPFQVDVIPVPMRNGWALNCEDPVTFADEALRGSLAERYPDVWRRIAARRSFMADQLGVAVNPSVLPLSDTPLWLPPFWLESDLVLTNG